MLKKSRGKVMLRSLRFSDGPSIREGLTDEEILSSSGIAMPVHASWFSILWWLKRTYVYLYCIDIGSKCNGFIGLYNLIPGVSAELTLVILDAALRGHGYGTNAFILFMRNLKRRRTVRRILIKVRRENSKAQRFWKRLGFTETGVSDGLIEMSLDPGMFYSSQ
jgi:RimJ/RimL family protein N-acetyltransferase